MPLLQHHTFLSKGNHETATYSPIGSAGATAHMMIIV